MRTNKVVLLVLLVTFFVSMLNVQTVDAKKAEELVRITVYSAVPQWVKEQKGEKAVGLRVSQGEYTMKSGATLLPGSQIFIEEENMMFTPGLVVDVGEGGATLQEKYYNDGAQLQVDKKGILQEKSK